MTSGSGLDDAQTEEPQEAAARCGSPHVFPARRRVVTLPQLKDGRQVNCRPKITCCGLGEACSTRAKEALLRSSLAPEAAQGLKRPQWSNSLGDQACQSLGEQKQSLDLIAAVFIMQTPLAKVLTIVAEQAIAIFTDARARPSDHLLGGKRNA